MTTKHDIAKQLEAVQVQLLTVRGWQLDSGALAVARCDALILLTTNLRDMVLDHVANPPKKNQRPLGKEQRSFLRAIFNYGPYRHGCGWQWGGRARSARLADSLEFRGLLVHDGGEYLLSAEGRKTVEEKS